MREIGCSKIYLSLAILETVSLANVSWHRRKETEIDNVMLNNTICVLFNTKELHKMAKSIKKQSFFSIVCGLYYWLCKR